MTKMLKKRIVSSVTALAMMISIGTANAMDIGDADDNNDNYVKVDCERVEELPDGGKIYVYNIGGEENKFPVPPEGFVPLTATDEQLMTYGFPPRPSDKNTKDYKDWVELMQHYRSTPVPKIELSAVLTDNNGNSSSREAPPNLNSTMAGYGSMVDKCYYNQLQMDFVQPTILPTSSKSTAELFLGFGDPFLSQKSIMAGTKKIYMDDYYAFFRVIGKSSTVPKEFKVDNFSVNPKDKIHIYMSFQRANNLLNIYFANSTTGEAVPYLREFSADEYYSGNFAVWGVYRPSDYDLCGFLPITFQNCKAMTNISDTWMDLSKLGNIYKWYMYGKNWPNIICEPSSITNNNSFTCTWKATS